MKLIKFVIAFFFTIVVSAQTSKKDLFIFIETSKKYISADDKMTFERYDIFFNLPCDGYKYVMSVNNNGDLQLDELLVGKPTPSISFKYVNENFNNNPIIIHKGQMKNKLNFDKMKCGTTYEQFVTILKQFNLFIITDKEVTGDYYVAKRVYFEANGGM